MDNPAPLEMEENLFINLKNLSSMVQTDISQLSSETSEWRQILRNYRDEFGDYTKLLQQSCSQPLNREQLQDVEHLQNQLHIQLINIHDVKQHIKNHERKIQLEQSGKENLSEVVYAEHERLLDEFLSLENSLQELRNEFKNFVSEVSC
jgi:hypothetical protein